MAQTELTTLEAASNAVSRVFEEQNRIALACEVEFETKKRTASAAEFARLRTAAEMSRIKADDAREVASKASELDLSAEHVRQKVARQESAQTAIDKKLQELTACDASLKAFDEELRRLAGLKVLAGQRHSQILLELNKLRIEAAAAIAA